MTTTTTTTHGPTGKHLLLTLVALVVLTFASLGFHYANLGATGIIIALAIAALKVGIVGFVFMELSAASAATRIVAATCVVFVMLLCLGIVGDVAFR